MLCIVASFARYNQGASLPVGPARAEAQWTPASIIPQNPQPHIQLDNWPWTSSYEGGRSLTRSCCYPDAKTSAQQLPHCLITYPSIQPCDDGSTIQGTASRFTKVLLLCRSAAVQILFLLLFDANAMQRPPHCQTVTACSEAQADQ